MKLTNALGMMFLVLSGYSTHVVAKSFVEKVSDGNLDEIKSMIEKGADVNKTEDNTDQSKSTPLTRAAGLGRVDIARLLIASGARVNYAYSDSPLTSPSVTPLQAAAMFGQNDMVNLLISNGAKINFPFYSGKKPLSIACEYGFLSTANLLIQNGANSSGKNASDFCGVISTNNAEQLVVQHRVAQLQAQTQQKYDAQAQTNNVGSGLLGLLVKGYVGNQLNKIDAGMAAQGAGAGIISRAYNDQIRNGMSAEQSGQPRPAGGLGDSLFKGVLNAQLDKADALMGASDSTVLRVMKGTVRNLVNAQPIVQPAVQQNQPAIKPSLAPNNVAMVGQASKSLAGSKGKIPTKGFFTRTGTGRTAVYLDGNNSYSCTWSTCPDGLVCGMKFYGAENGTSTTWQLPTNKTGGKAPFTFEIEWTNTGFTYIYQGERTGDFVPVASWAAATTGAGDTEGYCSRQ